MAASFYTDANRTVFFIADAGMAALYYADVNLRVLFFADIVHLVFVDVPAKEPKSCCIVCLEIQILLDCCSCNGVLMSNDTETENVLQFVMIHAHKWNTYATRKIASVIQFRCIPLMRG